MYLDSYHFPSRRPPHEQLEEAHKIGGGILNPLIN